MQLFKTRRFSAGAGVLMLAAPLLVIQLAAADEFDDGLAAYLNGNYARAMALWMPLAEAGNRNAQNNIAVLHENGEGVPRDYAVAARFYRLAAGQGHADAQASLGALYENGRGVPKDLIRAHMWFDIAATIATTTMLWSNLGGLVGRSRVAAQLSPEQVAQAQSMARRCQGTNYAACD